MHVYPVLGWLTAILAMVGCAALVAALAIVALGKLSGLLAANEEGAAVAPAED